MAAIGTPMPPRRTLESSPTFPPATKSNLSLRIADSTRTQNDSRPSTSHFSGPALGALSPVTPAGTYLFDRVLKSARVLKRRKRTNAWKPVYIVLRPNFLSVYKDKEETRLRHQINLVDITAVALRTDRKRKGEHDGCFGLYTPARNYHFEADSLLEAEQWVTLIRRESRLDEEEMSVLLSSPEENRQGTRGFGGFRRLGRLPTRARDGSSSPDSIEHARPRGSSAHRMLAMRSSSTVQELSGPEVASYSDFSDTPHTVAVTEPTTTARSNREGDAAATGSAGMSSSQRRMLYMTTKSAGGARPDRPEPAEAFDGDDRVVQQGYVLCLRSRGGVRQWKRCWAVLRAKNLSLYKSDEEYSALLILPLTSVVDAGDIDAISKTRRFCMQVITGDRSYRFCVSTEEDLSKWVGSLKSIIARRRDAAARPR